MFDEIVKGWREENYFFSLLYLSGWTKTWRDVSGVTNPGTKNSDLTAPVTLRLRSGWQVRSYYTFRLRSHHSLKPGAIGIQIRHD